MAALEQTSKSTSARHDTLSLTTDGTHAVSGLFQEQASIDWLVCLPHPPFEVGAVVHIVVGRRLNNIQWAVKVGDFGNEFKGHIEILLNVRPEMELPPD